jgi:hypothetical protein
MLLTVPYVFVGVECKEPDPLSRGFLTDVLNAEEYMAKFLKAGREPVNFTLSEVEREMLKDWRPDDPIRQYQDSDPESGFEWGFFNLRLEKRLPTYRHTWACK